MKSTLIKRDGKKVTYPCLGIAQGELVVLFSDSGIGTVIYDNRPEEDRSRIGYHCNTWQMSVFELFEGEIKLSNY